MALYRILLLFVCTLIAGSSDASVVWRLEGPQSGSNFGISSASAGDVNGDGHLDFIVGADALSDPDAGEGAVFVYHGSANGPSMVPDWSVQGDQALANFGHRVAGAGDVNNDGFDDVIVGAYFYDGDDVDGGRALVYLGSSQGLSLSPVWSVDGPIAGARMGSSVRGAGDVNGDGFDDVIVGATLAGNAGRAYVYHGSRSGPSLTESWSAGGNSLGAFFGFPVNTAGDVNGDGYDDVIVGSIFDQGAGRADVFYGSAGGLSLTPDWFFESDRPSTFMGHGVGAAGDVNGDGYGDVIVGAPFYTNGESNEGRAYLFLGSAEGLAETPIWHAESDQAAAFFGFPTDGAGDLNSDGYDDVVIGAIYHDGGEEDEGAAFVYLGSPTGLGATPAWIIESDQPLAEMGFSVSSAGDPDLDGDDDLLLGVRVWDGDELGEVDLGQVVLFSDPSGIASGSVSDGSHVPGTPLTLDRSGESSLELSWSASCSGGDSDYAIYEGTLGNFTSHTALVCSTGGMPSHVLEPTAGNRYYLVVPTNGLRDGSYGRDALGFERSLGPDPCRSRLVADCP